MIARLYYSQAKVLYNIYLSTVQSTRIFFQVTIVIECFPILSLLFFLVQFLLAEVLSINTEINIICFIVVKQVINLQEIISNKPLICACVDSVMSAHNLELDKSFCAGNKQHVIYGACRTHAWSMSLCWCIWMCINCISQSMQGCCINIWLLCPDSVRSFAETIVTPFIEFVTASCSTLIDILHVHAYLNKLN